MEQDQQILLRALALVIDKLGDKGDGCKEIYFSDTALTSVPPLGQIQVDRHPEKPGFCLRYFRNTTIDGVTVDGDLQHTKSA